jgi:hypothetical protein
MSWTDEDVTFLGEDPYGDCAGNIFAQAAVESRRRSQDSARSSVDEGSRDATPRTSVNESVAHARDDDSKARAFFGIGPI